MYINWVIFNAMDANNKFPNSVKNHAVIQADRLKAMYQQIISTAGWSLILVEELKDKIMSMKQEAEDAADLFFNQVSDHTTSACDYSTGWLSTSQIDARWLRIAFNLQIRKQMFKMKFTEDKFERDTMTIDVDIAKTALEMDYMIGHSNDSKNMSMDNMCKTNEIALKVHRFHADIVETMSSRMNIMDLSCTTSNDLYGMTQSTGIAMITIEYPIVIKWSVNHNNTWISNIGKEINRYENDINHYHNERMEQ